MMGRLKSDQGQLFYEFRLGDALWDRFNGGAAGTRWYYRLPPVGTVLLG